MGLLFFCRKKEMEYSLLEKKCAGFFRDGLSDGEIPGTGISVFSTSFNSHSGITRPEESVVTSSYRGLFRSSTLTSENDNFNYHIFSPENQSGGAIILLHGLNERNWSKYIPWAVSLATMTERPVILFPIAYHMERSPRSWTDRHTMMPLLERRIKDEPGTRQASFINVALSTRMTLSPQRFLMSGYQTVNDLAALIGSVNSGNHPYILKRGTTDIFAYSIGAMITQALILSEGSLLPDDSRIFLFSGGSTLQMMNGISKFIMDSKAFDRLIKFYIDEIVEDEGLSGTPVKRLIDETPVGSAFFRMSSPGRLKRENNSPFARLEGRLKAVSFSSDTVIPSQAVSDALSGTEVEIVDPGYPCTHEKPFPLFDNEYAKEVDRVYDRVFEEAAVFFSQGSH